MPSMRRLFLIGFVISMLAIAGCGGGDDSSSTASSAGEESTAAEKAEAPEEKTKPQVKPPKGPPPKKVVTEELEEGSGPAAKAGDQVTVQYVGVNYRSGSEFDASWDRGEPFTFTLGVHEVISGWDMGIEGMKVGGRRELIIPPNHAYGASGSPPAIPPNETLVFVVDLEAIN
jgi:peptidylprolyl isomerase